MALLAEVPHPVPSSPGTAPPSSWSPPGWQSPSCCLRSPAYPSRDNCSHYRWSSSAAACPSAATWNGHATSGRSAAANPSHRRCYPASSPSRSPRWQPPRRCCPCWPAT